MFRRMMLLLCWVVGVALMAFPGAASAQDLPGYKVKLVGWPGDQTANSVAIGDVNGDGIPDYVIGDTMAGANGRAQSGSVYVVYGQTGDKTTGRTVDLSAIPLAGQGSSTVGYRIDGWSAYDHFGASVATGDVTSDGIGDIVVGDPDASPYGRSQAGNVYVIDGQKGTSTPEIDVSNMPSNQGTTITGWAAGDRTGQSVAVGRFNSDSPYGCKYASTQNSLAIGAPGGSPNGQSQAGEVYDLYGTDFTSGPGVLDLNGLSPGKGYLIEGSWGGDQLGQSVADGGDVNQNCSNAILAGDPQAGPNNMPQSGTVYVIFGQPRSPGSGNEDVATLEQNGQGYRINGPGSYAHFGASVANAGDVNGDNIPDVVAGAPDFNSGAGEAIVTWGKKKTNVGDINTSPLGPAAGYVIQGYFGDRSFSGTSGTQTSWGNNACQAFTWGTYNNQPFPNSTSVTEEGEHTGATVAGLGDVNKDGVPDVLVGSPGWNQSAGAVSIVDGQRGTVATTIQLHNLGSLGTTMADTNGPTPQTNHPYGNGNLIYGFDASSNPQILEQTEEAFSGADPHHYWLYCSNYMVEHGDQAGSVVASTGTGSGAFAIIGAPSYGESNRLSWNGTPQSPTVWFSDGGAIGQVGVSAFGPSGEADWTVTPGNGAAYVLGVNDVAQAAPAGK
jgi:hypothetical protein